MSDQPHRWFDDDDDVQLARRWEPVQPESALITRGEQHVRRVVIEQELGLVTEWLEMLRARPVANGFLVAAAAAALLMLTPLGSLWASLAQMGSG